MNSRKERARTHTAIFLAIAAALIAGSALFYKASSMRETYIVSQIIAYDETGTGTKTTTYQLDGRGNPLSKTIAYDNYVSDKEVENETTTYNYERDDAGILTKSADGSVVTTYSIEESDGKGRPTIIASSNDDEDTRGPIYTFAYSDDGELATSSSLIEGKTFSLKVASSYTDDGFVSSIVIDGYYVANSGKSSTSHDYTQTYSYSYAKDDANRIAAATETLTDSSGKSKKTSISYSYDENGNVSKMFENGNLAREYSYAAIREPSAWAKINAGLMGIESLLL